MHHEPHSQAEKSRDRADDAGHGHPPRGGREAASQGVSWIKPGKVAWDWWNDWNLKGVDFKAGINFDIQNIPNHIPIYEMEATIMYLGILVDTNRFKMHTDARTFEAAAALQNWGANTSRAEKALCEDYLYFSMKNALIQQAKPYYNHFMIAAIDDETLDKTMMAQVSQALLLIKGCVASFTIAKVKTNPNAVAVSARSDGSYNVQKIMEKLNGGGHFSAAAVEREGVSVQQMKDMILNCIEEELKNEGNIA